MTGKKINRWLVLKFDRFDHRREAYWLCKCDCGSVKSVSGYSLRKGTSKGCKKCRQLHRYGSKYHIKDDVAIFTTKNGIKFLVSVDDINKIKEYGWCVGNNGYVVAHIKNKVTMLHRFLNREYDGKIIDHINGDKLDNRRENIRCANDFQNAQNQNISTRNTSGYKGAHFNTKEQKWQANIRAFNKTYSLGWFATKEQAALAYNEAAKKLHGKYACLNPIGDTCGYRTIKKRGCENV